MATVIVSAPLAGKMLERLRAKGHHVLVGASPSGLGHHGLLAMLQKQPETEALIPLPTDRIDRVVLDAAPKLRVVANHAVGIDNLDLEALSRRGIVATNTPGVLTEATADATWALLLDACRNITRGDRLVRSGGWQGWSPTLLLGPPVHGATLGIIGFGRIGQAVARRARGFEMRVLFFDPHADSELGCQDPNIRPVSLDELLADSDIVSIHSPLTDETRGLINGERLARMKPGSVLVNTARGPCVDEAALAEALRSGHLFAAGLDVYEQEPQIHEALRELDNVVLAPHVGSADFVARERMGSLCVDAVLAVFAGREPENRVA